MKQSSSVIKNKTRDYVVAFLFVGVMAGLCFPLSPAIGYQTVGLIFLGIISVLSLFLGRGALLFAALLNFVIWNFFFIPPLYTFRVHSFHDLVSLFAYLLIAIVGITFISRIRRSQLTLKKSQERITILLSLLESLNNATSIKDIVSKVQEGLRTHFSAETIVYLKEKTGGGVGRRPFGNIDLDTPETFSKALDVFLTSADNLDFSSNLGAGIHFFPLSEPRRMIGVIGVLFNAKKGLEDDKEILLRSFIRQIASALDREMSIDAAKEKEIMQESEKLFQTVLSSVSHELRTPISVIRTAVSGLADEKTSSNRDTRIQICEELDFASARLNHIVENILDMSRIESGHLKLNLQYCDVTDLFGTVARELKNEYKEHPFQVEVEEELPLILADIKLLNQALVNIIHNSMSYSLTGSPIIVRASSNPEKQLLIEVIDQGKGVPEEYIPRLFDKFFRVPGSKSGGTGLGLTIVKAIIEAHGGTIGAGNIPGGGLRIAILLPIAIEDGNNQE